MYYLRGIEIEKWDGKDNLDAVSVSDLRTSDNDLSVWQINDMDELEEVGLTMALTKSSIKDVSVVILDADKISELGLAITEQPGTSNYTEKNNLHKNISVPTFWEIGFLSEYIHEQLQDEKNFHYFAEEELKETFYKVVKEGNMDYRHIGDKSLKNLRGALIAICCLKKDGELRTALEQLAPKK